MKRLLALAALALLIAAPPALADGAAVAPDPAGRWESFPLKFSILRQTSIAVGGKHEAALKIPLPSESGGFTLQPEGSNLSVDVNGDGAVDQKVKEGAPIFLQAKYDDGATARYAVRFFRGARMAWFYETATSMAGTAAGEKISLVDADLNGRYDDLGKDAVVIGRGPWAAPLGKVLLIKDKLYHAKVDPRGESISLQEYKGETGNLDLRKNFRAPGALQYAVVQSGDNYFEMSGKGAGLPAGKYALLCGRLEKGKKACNIVRGDMKEIEVGSSDAAPSWGPPLRIVFKATRNDEKIHIDAALRFLGAADEEYKDFENVISTPDVQIKSREGVLADRGRFATG